MISGPSSKSRAGATMTSCNPDGKGLAVQNTFRFPLLLPDAGMGGFLPALFRLSSGWCITRTAIDLRTLLGVEHSYFLGTHFQNLHPQ